MGYSETHSKPKKIPSIVKTKLVTLYSSLLTPQSSVLNIKIIPQKISNPNQSQNISSTVNETISYSTYIAPIPIPSLPIVQSTPIVSNTAQIGTNLSTQQVMQQQLAIIGWSGYWNDVNTLISGESGWRLDAINSLSGACGLGQQDPCQGLDSLAAVGQCQWVINYIKARYGNPAVALQHEYQVGWY